MGDALAKLRRSVKDAPRQLVYMPATPVGVRVPRGGSMCANCAYVCGDRCTNAYYVASVYVGKASGDDWFVDGLTGKVVKNGQEFCCSFWGPQ